jgi:GntR family transcriptional regulator
VAHVAINPNTVFKAYRELEMLGLVEGRTGSGTFVKQRLAGPLPQVQEALSNDLARWVAKARKAGLGDEELEALLRIALHKK